MDTCLSLEVVQCRQFDPVSGPFSMNNQRVDSQSVYSIGSEKNLVSVKSRRTYFKTKRKKCGLFETSLIFVIVALSLAIFLLIMLHTKSLRSNVCENEDCMRIAASLKESMDTSVDPCDDFYKYACGRWPQSHPLPESSLTNSWFSERSNRVTRVIRDLLRENSTAHVPWAVRQAKTLYQSCMDLESLNALGLMPLLSLLEELDLPQIPAAFTQNTTDFVRQMARVKRVLGKDVFFGLDVYPDPRNRTRNVMILDIPTIETPFPNDKELQKRLHKWKKHMRNLEEELDEEEIVSASIERNYMIDVMKEVLSNGTVEYGSCKLKKSSSFSREQEVSTVVNDIYELSGVFFRLSHSDNYTSITEEEITDEDYMQIDDLQTLTDEYIRSVNSSVTSRKIWRPFLEEVFRDILTLDKEDRILVADIEYLKKVALVLSSTEETLLETVVWWSVVDIVTPYSSKDLRKVWSNYLDEIMQVEIGEPRSLNCAKAVNELMGMAVSWLFVDPLFHEETDQKVLEMLRYIKQSFHSMVYNSDWMDKRTKLATYGKIKQMTSVTGYPNWLFNKQEINQYYEGIDLSMNEYLENMMQLIRIRSSAQLEELHDINPDNQPYWATDPTDVNAFHTFQANQITIPAGILQFPFYNLGLEALNYGAIGAVIGHELTHGFDNSGRQYDGDGNVRQWWTSDTIAEYNKRAKCFVAQYSSYYEEEINEYIDGDLTLGENIADNSGLKEAAKAYEIWKASHGKEPLLPGFTNFTHEQLLFLGFAHLWCENYSASSLKWMLQDTHSPGHVRLRVVLRNSEEFSDAWKCPLGSNMNPVKKCRLW
ncbi:endothelin-converting enzyme homolog [Belonocnema kinseyi]|uniref:endothelin-converting enzyme homolog n=1 Tax=Belonocnema kinseyi TaxID=2817044 RepID=UPI00143D4BD0|nr:endothelin-converting enzyme homolog [Belonocnema kinseyi]